MNKLILGGGVLLAAVAALTVCGPAKAAEKKDMSSKTAESTVTTNDNGSVSRTFVESSVTTNGNLVTEHRRETRTSMDMKGNVLETTTSEYAQSYSVGDTGWKFPPVKDAVQAKTDTSGFLGLKFGAVYSCTNSAADPEDATLLRAKFKPAKALAGFDDYYVYLTPKTKKVVKVCACAREAVEPAGRWRKHYLLEALEKKYGTWARLRSIRRPLYTFDVAEDKGVAVCLAGASDEYETVVMAWDDAMARVAAEEHEELREEARKTAAERRTKRVEEAADAF